MGSTLFLIPQVCFLEICLDVLYRLQLKSHFPVSLLQFSSLEVLLGWPASSEAGSLLRMQCILSENAVLLVFFIFDLLLYTQIVKVHIEFTLYKQLLSIYILLQSILSVFYLFYMAVNYNILRIICSFMLSIRFKRLYT